MSALVSLTIYIVCASCDNQLFIVTTLLIIIISFTATPVGIIIPGIQGTTDLPPEIIHTESTPIPVPEMTTGQCQEDTGMMRKFKNLILPGHKLTAVTCNLVTGMAMAEAGNPEATWTVQVVAPTENHMMVTVRYIFNSVVVKEDSCGNGRAAK